MSLHSHDDSTFFYPIHRSYFCVRRIDGAARIYFSSLYLSLNVSFYGGACQRERGKKKEEEEEKAQKKPLRRDWDLNPRTLSPEPSVLSIMPRRPALNSDHTFLLVNKV